MTKLIILNTSCCFLLFNLQPLDLSLITLGVTAETFNSFLLWVRLSVSQSVGSLVGWSASHSIGRSGWQADSEFVCEPFALAKVNTQNVSSVILHCVQLTHINFQLMQSIVLKELRKGNLTSTGLYIQSS